MVCFIDFVTFSTHWPSNGCRSRYLVSDDISRRKKQHDCKNYRYSISILKQYHVQHKRLTQNSQKQRGRLSQLGSAYPRAGCDGSKGAAQGESFKKKVQPVFVFFLCLASVHAFHIFQYDLLNIVHDISLPRPDRKHAQFVTRLEHTVHTIRQDVRSGLRMLKEGQYRYVASSENRPEKGSENVRRMSRMIALPRYSIYGGTEKRGPNIPLSART